MFTEPRRRRRMAALILSLALLLGAPLVQVAAADSDYSAAEVRFIEWYESSPDNAAYFDWVMFMQDPQNAAWFEWATSSVTPQTPAQNAVQDVWWDLAGCETGYKYDNPNTGNGYYGFFQFSLSTWQSVGGPGYPHHHSYATQKSFAQKLQARSGWGQWPACSRQLGLR